jgi:hypothetical protein
MPDSEQEPTTGTSFWYWDGKFGLPVIVQCHRTDYGDLVIDDPEFIYLVAELVDQQVRAAREPHRDGDPLPPHFSIETDMMPAVGEFAGLIRSGAVTLIGVTSGL